MELLGDRLMYESPPAPPLPPGRAAPFHFSRKKLTKKFIPGYNDFLGET